MKLTGSSEEFVQFNGTNYYLNLAYPVVLMAFDILRDKGLSELERLHLALALLVKGNSINSLKPAEQEELLSEIFKQHIDLKEHELAAKLFKSKGKVFDFDIDAGRIAASFMQQYQIDLTDVQERNKISWAFFNALLDGLSPDTPFRQATAYRIMEIPDDATSEQKQQLQKMKTLYALTPDDAPEGTLDQEVAGMDRIERMKYLAKKLKKKRGDLNG